MQYNRELHISTAGSRRATQWPESIVLWSDFTGRLEKPIRSTETLEEYLAMPKARQDELKDVGGFVGGTFAGGRRKSANVQGRDLAALDLDNIPAGQTDEVLKRVDGLGCAAAVYSTRKHSGYVPRLRVLIPFDRTVLPDEYEPVARKLAALLGIGFCDPTTFDVNRFMYWPSCCSTGEYVFRVYDKPFCNADSLLAMYGDWKDMAQWPQVPGAEKLEQRRVAKQEDPTAKKGIIGAFCRTYSVTEAMGRFIAGIYEETTTPGRYTFTGGSTVGGAVVYDGDKFLYSHHATDPCSGLLVNAFDLVRLHMYGDRDDLAKEGTPANKLPSYIAMSRLALEDPAVAELIAKERHEEAVAAFAAQEPEGEVSEEDMSWLQRLSVDGSGNYQKTVNNIIIVLQNDARLKGRIMTDEFACRGVVIGPVPWNEETGKRQWMDVDDDGLFWYLETYYGFAQQDRQDKATAIVGLQNKINTVKQYLQGLKWDGVRRVDTLLTDYLGAEDNAYTHAVIRKFLCAAVARAVSPDGVKFDTMPIFTGPQGIGKSTFLRILGKEWFSDSLTNFEGKEAAEMIQGTWINEVGELTAMNRQETSAVKQFLSKQDDIYRAAYGRHTERYPRRCVFCGTSNEGDFLKDTTGNRRFWPVDVGVRPAEKSVWKDLPKEADLVWAEAYTYWVLGEPLYLSKELEEMAALQQEGHTETSGKEGLIRDYLEKKIPQNWDQLSIGQQRQFAQGYLSGAEEAGLKEREKVCAAEIWTVCLGGEVKYMKNTDGREINGILTRIGGWKKMKSPRYFGPHGSQRGFERETTK